MKKISDREQAWQIGGSLCAAILMCAFPAFADGVRLAPIPPIAKPPVVTAEVEPKDWLAFLSYKSGLASIEYYVFDRTPHTMIFNDGRVFWRNDDIGQRAPNSREMWRESNISSEALAAFTRKLKADGFLTVQKPAPVKPTPDAKGRITRRVVVDAGTTVIGARINGKKRIVSEHALGLHDEDKDNRYIQTMIGMEKAIRALVPKESKRYEPETIRVVLFAHNTRSTPKYPVADWPLAPMPDTKKDAHYYSGSNAETIIEALGRYPKVKIDGWVYTAVWAPAIAVPQLGVRKSSPN